MRARLCRHGDRSREPEGRRRQDHHLREPCRLAGRDAAPRAADRPGPAGQRHHGLRRGQERASSAPLRRAARRVPVGEALIVAGPRAASRCCRATRISRPPKSSSCSSRIASFACARRWRRCVDRYDYILIDCPPALNMLTRQRAGGGRQRADPDAVRVLRARRPVARSSARSSRSATTREPEARDRRHPAHDVRPAEQPRERGLGAARPRTSATRSSAP